MKYVLLTDNNDDVVMVVCRDLETAEEVAEAAVWGAGGVSAWLIPTTAMIDVETVLSTLRADGSIVDVAQDAGNFTEVRFTTGAS
jgi:alanine dehydrogenase